jgi:tetraacyldisaccharide 4'-kinase
MKLLRLLLFPFSILYGIGVIIRNFAYDYGVLKSHKFDLPIICVGNLSVGGSGKSPMTEYLINLLKWNFTLAAVSRGYGRKTSGFHFVEIDDLVENTGDEPLQMKRKFEGISVVVCENRVEAIEHIAWENDLIILDDAFQHRSLNPGLSILLFEYSFFQSFQTLLPAGNLREPMFAKDRASIIIITKCPQNITEHQKQAISKRINLKTDQSLFFSYLRYGKLKSVFEDRLSRDLSSLNDSVNLILLTGIANPKPLLDQFNAMQIKVIHHEYPDHYNFTERNIVKLVNAFKKLGSGDNLIITTEKDAQRLNSMKFKNYFSNIPLFYLPVEADFAEAEKVVFNNLIIKYATESANNRRIHQA